MDDLINRQDAINLLKKWSDGYEYIETDTELAIKEFQRLPSATPERKLGHWIDTGSGQECSVCHEIQYGYDNYRYYCSHCGAKMGEQE